MSDEIPSKEEIQRMIDAAMKDANIQIPPDAMEEIRKALDEATSNLEGVDNDLDQMMEEVRRECGNIEFPSSAELQAQIDAATREMESIKNQMPNINDMINEMDKAVAEAQRNLDQIEDPVLKAELERQIDELKRSISSLK